MQSPQLSDDPITATTTSRCTFRAAILVALTFFVLSALILPLLSRWRGDERYYTDAAIRMVQTGDYLTPYEGDGSLRFNKPILNYWLTAGSFHLFGISVFAARFAQLTAGSLALLAVYRLARILFEDREVALFTVAMMAINEQCLNASVRSTTDIVQYALLTLALTGFVAILFRSSRAWLDYLLAYGGLALAALTKGGMAFVLLCFIAIFTVVSRRRFSRTTAGAPPPLPRLSTVIPWYAIPLAIAPLAIWLGLNVNRHGAQAVRKLWFDQVSRRLDGSAFFDNLVTYGTDPFIALFPLVLLLIIVGWSRWRDLRPLLAARKLEISFALGWYLAVAVIILPANITRNRYLLPTYPMLAASLAYLIVAMTRRSPAAARAAGVAARVVAVALLVFALFLTLVALRLPPTALVGTLFLAAAAAFITWRLHRSAHRITDWVPVALLLLAAYRISDLSIRSYLFATPTEDIVRQFDAHASATITPLATVGLNDQAAHVRLSSAGRIQVTNLPASATPDTLRQYDAILVDAAADAPDLGPTYQSFNAGIFCDRWRPQDIVRFAVGRTTRDEVYRKRGKTLRLLVRRPSIPTTTTITTASSAAGSS